MDDSVKTGMRPTHELKVKDPETSRHTTVGVAWDSDEWMNIQLNPGVSLSYVDQQQLGLKLTIFPIEKKKFNQE
jgi:hypothetical protein